MLPLSNERIQVSLGNQLSWVDRRMAAALSQRSLEEIAVAFADTVKKQQHLVLIIF